MKPDKYIFIMEGDIQDIENYRKVLVSGTRQELDEILEDFKAFLLACQFSDKLVSQITRDGDNYYG